MSLDSIRARKLSVVEIFHSIQGEGANAGKSAVFVRLAHCNMDCAFCDTQWQSGEQMTVGEVIDEVNELVIPANRPNTLLIWTGGEPTLQLDDEILSCFGEFYNCIETNGTNPVPSLIQYISCSPKVSVEQLNQNFKRVNEFRFPMAIGDLMPNISQLPPADNYFLSPIFKGKAKEMMSIDMNNIGYCVDLIKSHPQWKLSIQLHKILNIK